MLTTTRVKLAFSVFLIMGGLAVSILTATQIVTELTGDRNVDEEQTLEARISILSENLELASRAISAIELEIEERKNLVVELEQQQEAAEALSQLNKDQFEAVAQTIRLEVEARSSGDFWRNLLATTGVASFFWLLGLATPVGYRKLRSVIDSS